MSKKLKTRKGIDGYNYPYTHEDLIFNDEGASLSQQLENFATKEFVNDAIANASINGESGFSGDYNDLINKPEIPTVTNDLTDELKANYDTAYERSVSGMMKMYCIDGSSGSLLASHTPSTDRDSAVFYSSKAYITSSGSIGTDGNINAKAFYEDGTALEDKYVTDESLSAVAKSGSYNDLTNKPSIPSIEGLATESFVTNKIAEAQLNNGGEVNLEGLATKDELNLKADKTELFSKNYNDLTDKPTIPTVPTNVSSFNNDAGYISSIPAEYVTDSELNAKGYLTAHQDISGKADKTYVNDELAKKANSSDLAAVATSGSYNDLTNKPIIPSIEGLATEDYVDNAIEENKYSHPSTHPASIITTTDDKQFVSQSEKNNWNSGFNHAQTTHAPVDAQKNSDITKAEIEAKLIGNISTHTHDQYLTEQDISGKADKSELFSGSYNDLTNKPVIPSVQGLASESYVNQQISKIQHPVYDDTYIKNQLANKANKSELFSGDYNDLSNKPSIPSIAGLASESFVKNEIAKAQLEIEGEIPVINLDGLATKDELALKADKTEIPNIEGLASESYVQQEIAKAQVGGSGGSGSGSGDGGYVTDDNVSDEEKEYVDDMMYSALGGLKFVKTTQERYDALTDKDPNTIYIVVSPENMSNSTGGEEGVSDIYNLSWIDGVNLSDTGSLVSGDSQASYRTSDFIKINPEFSYRVNTSSSSQFQVFYYDKNKNYIGKSTIRNDKTEFALYGYEGFIEAPEDVKYFRIRTSNKTSSIEINEIGRKEDTPVAFQFRNGYTVASNGSVSAASGYMASGNIKLEPDYDYSITFRGNKTRIVFFNTDGNKTGNCLPTDTTYYNEKITLTRTHIPEAAVSFRMRFATGGEVNMNNIHEHLVITRTPRASKHLLPISTWMQSTGFDENGGEIEDISAMNTGYVQIESGYNYMYTLKRGVPFGFQIFYYDASLSFISNSEVQNDPVGNARFNIPSNAAYFRIKVSQENSLTVDNANENIEIKKIPAVDGLLYSFGVLSDVHVDAGSDGNFYDHNHATSDYRKAVKFLEDEGAEFIAYGGDMATGDPGVSEQDYRKVLEILKNSHIPNYMISGNHDYGYFFKALIESRKYYTVEKGNDLFIFVNTQDRGATGGVDREIVDAVRAIIESNPNKRLFLFFHYFIRNHGAGDGATDVKYYTGDTLGDGYEKYPLSLEWANLIINTPNLIFCHGHSHFRFNCVNVYAQNNYSHVDGECHSVHIPSCAVPREMSADSTSVNNWPEGSEGYMVEVFADRVVFHAVQLSSYRYLTTYDFTIDLPQGN